MIMWKKKLFNLLMWGEKLELPEDIDEDTKKAFEEDIKEFVSGKVKTISGDEASKLLLSFLSI
jgi:hypothetical protein